MSWRHELKFVIDQASFLHLYYDLAPVMLRDEHDDAATGLDGIPGGYLVRSLYFDDYSRSGIFDKLAGADPRQKYRIRIYNNGASVIRLERKAKSGTLTQKRSSRLNRDQVEHLLTGDLEPLSGCLDGGALAAGQDQDVMRQFYTEWQTRLLRPLLLVDYRRTPLIWPDGNVRITFDRELATGLYRQDLWDDDAGLQPVLPPGTVILEVKYDAYLPDFLRGLLHVTGASPLAVSKYVQCAAFCRSSSWEDQS